MNPATDQASPPAIDPRAPGKPSRAEAGSEGAGANRDSGGADLGAGGADRLPGGAAATPGVADSQPSGRFDLLDRIATATVTVVPMLAVGLAGWQLWDRALHWQDLLLLALFYVPTAFGITIGFHRLLTHRSFKTRTSIRFVLAALGSAALEGPVIEWVANHRKHHAFSDREGDPHSPHVGHPGGLRGALSGLTHAHLGWLFRSEFASQERYAPDLLADPAIRLVDRTFLLWAALGLALPFALGVALTQSVWGGLTGLLWGGAVRIFLLHHVTFSINSLCHFFGRRDFDTPDESRNLRWLTPLSMGEAWHNSHHAFPTSAAHGLGRRQFDPSASVITALERLGLAWDVVRISPERQRTKSLTQS